MSKRKTSTSTAVKPQATEAKTIASIKVDTSAIKAQPEVKSAKADTKETVRPAAKADTKQTAEPGVKAEVKETVKPAAKETARPAAKEAAKPVAKETARPAAKETAKPASKAPAKAAKTTTRPAAKSEAKKEVKPELFIQFQGKETQTEWLVEQAKQAFIADGHRESTIKSIKLYLKPEENAAYYVINENFAGKVDLF